MDRRVEGLVVCLGFLLAAGGCDRQPMPNSPPATAPDTAAPNQVPESERSRAIDGEPRVDVNSSGGGVHVNVPPSGQGEGVRVDVGPGGVNVSKPGE